MTLTLRTLQRINVERSIRWHPGGLSDWSVLEWAAAMAGEAGEACNAAKKLKRMLTGAANISSDPARQINDLEEAKLSIGDEVADVILYALLLAEVVGVDAQEAVIQKFNRVSQRYGFPERLQGELRTCECGRQFKRRGKTKYCSVRCQKRFYMRRYKPARAATEARG